MSLQSNNIKSSPWNWIINISIVSQWNGLPDTENLSEQVTVEIYFVYAYLNFLLIYNDIFSITIKSGDCAGQLIFFRRVLATQSLVEWALCTGAFSSWNK